MNRIKKAVASVAVGLTLVGAANVSGVVDTPAIAAYVGYRVYVNSAGRFEHYGIVADSQGRTVHVTKDYWTREGARRAAWRWVD